MLTMLNSPNSRVTAEAIEKTPQSTWFDCYCTGRTLTDILLVEGHIVSHI